jgi:hypothetical protein
MAAQVRRILRTQTGSSSSGRQMQSAQNVLSSRSALEGGLMETMTRWTVSWATVTTMLACATTSPPVTSTTDRSGPRSCARLADLVLVNDSALGSSDLRLVEDTVEQNLTRSGFRFEPDATEALRLFVSEKPNAEGTPCLEVKAELVRARAAYVPVVPFSAARCGARLAMNATPPLPGTGATAPAGTSGDAGTALVSGLFWAMSKLADAAADPTGTRDRDLALEARASRFRTLGELLGEVLWRVHGVCAPPPPAS